jgi:hypothetical protein
MADPTGPLTEADLEQTKDQLEALKLARTEMDRAQRAGIDVSEQRKRADELEQQLLRIKNTYFPGR